MLPFNCEQILSRYSVSWHEPTRPISKVLRVSGLGLGDSLLAFNAAAFFAEVRPNASVVVSMPRSCVEALEGVVSRENLIVVPVDVKNSSDRRACYAEYGAALTKLYDSFAIDCVVWSYASCNNPFLAYVKGTFGFRVSVSAPVNSFWKSTEFSAAVHIKSAANQDDCLHAGLLYGAFPFIPLLSEGEIRTLLCQAVANPLPDLRGPSKVAHEGSLIICPNASTVHKSLNPGQIVELLLRLNDRFPSIKISVATEEEAYKLAESLRAYDMGRPTAFLVGDILQLRCHLRSSAAVITADSGTAHLAVACCQRRTRIAVLLGQRWQNASWNYALPNIRYAELSQAGIEATIGFLS